MNKNEKLLLIPITDRRLRENMGGITYVHRSGKVSSMG